MSASVRIAGATLTTQGRRTPAECEAETRAALEAFDLRREGYEDAVRAVRGRSCPRLLADDIPCPPAYAEGFRRGLAELAALREES
jgi:hypothetical protein